MNGVLGMLEHIPSYNTHNAGFIADIVLYTYLAHCEAGPFGICYLPSLSWCFSAILSMDNFFFITKIDACVAAADSILENETCGYLIEVHVEIDFGSGLAMQTKRWGKNFIGAFEIVRLMNAYRRSGY